jgi:hypothetical protein
MARKKLKWEVIAKDDEKSLKKAASHSFCLYVFRHPKDLGRPFYIGKAKYFGPNQTRKKNNASARYNGGYQYLIHGMLRGGYRLYIARLGEKFFAKATRYEQRLIDAWDPIRAQKRTRDTLPVDTTKPWARKR